MPTYDYVCRACGHELELFQSITAAPKKKCPACKKSKLERRIGAGAAILFRGSGFYQTDYRSDSYKQAAEAEKSGAKPEVSKETQSESSDKPPAADSAAKTPAKGKKRPK